MSGISPGATSWTLPDPDYVRERVSLDFWHSREIPPLDRILGELVTTTSRIMVVGPTGIGKTNMLMGAGMASADGADFLHWRGCGRPRRVLYIDGEMSRRLFKARLEDAIRRHGNRPKTLFAFSREDFEGMPPLDTDGGQKYIDHVIEVLGPEIVFLDNIQALTIGDLREPESWRKILPWSRDLTRRNKGQIWAHHTGLAEDHGYGDKTREWGLDTVILMETIERPDADIAFSLKFTKARERTPENRADFDPAVITLARDTWTSERGTAGGKRKAKDRVLELITDTIARYGEIPPASGAIPPDTPCAKEDLCRKACEAGCISEGSPEANRKAFYRAAKRLLAEGLIGKCEPWIWTIQ
jgi:AAA domain